MGTIKQSAKRNKSAYPQHGFPRTWSALDLADAIQVRAARAGDELAHTLRVGDAVGVLRREALIQVIVAAQHHVDWRWVKGHAGDPGNERADALANRGVAEHVALAAAAVAQDRVDRVVGIGRIQRRGREDELEADVKRRMLLRRDAEMEP